MVRTNDDTRAAFTGKQLMRTVLADIVERADFTIAAFDRKKALVAQVKGHIVAGVFQLTSVAGKLPCARKKARFFNLEDLWVGIVTGVQRPDRPQPCRSFRLLRVDAQLVAAMVEHIDAGDDLVTGDGDDKAEQSLENPRVL